MDETNWLWLGTLGMIGGSILLFLAGGKRTQDEEGHTIAHGLVPLFAAISYFAMARHQGQVTLPSGRVFLYARYLDWSITTPVLLLGLSMTALHGAHRRAGLIAGLLASDVVMIVTGLFFGMSEDPFNKWVWYITSCAAFLAVYYVLFGPLREEAQARDSERRSAYNRNVGILAVLWLLYPVIVILGPDGLEFWSATFATACITLLDLTAKVIYGFISMGGSKTITSSDVSRGEVSAAEISTHSVPSEAPVPGAAMPGDARQPARVV
jgi:bacteriorhodopsin